MARVRLHLHYADTRGELAEFKDARHGAVDDAFWDEDELVDYRPSSKRKKPKKKKGCPGNDFGPHVYVWALRVYKYDWWPDYGLDTSKRYEVKTCCGCNKTTGKSRYTEEFAKRVAKMGWYKANYGER